MGHSRAHSQESLIPALAWVSIQTELGEFWSGYSAKGLARIEFPENKRVHQHSELKGRQTTWHNLTIAAIEAVLKGDAPDELPPLDLGSATDFQRAIWKAIAAIAVGKTATYGELARAVNRPKGAQAAGQACGSNPIPVLIPCHRVLAANNRIGGFSGGLNFKRALLQREGVIPVD